MVMEDEMKEANESGNTPDTDGLMPLSVSYNMQWFKRGRAHDALTGHGAVMGDKTKKVLDYASANKMCRTCEIAKTAGKGPAILDCRANHGGSSKSMEAQVRVKLFNEAPNYGVKYSVFIGDDESSAIARTREEVRKFPSFSNALTTSQVHP